jgi:hypothetical protein
MAACPPISASAPRDVAFPQLLAAILTICLTPTTSLALDARLRWSPSPDTRVQGYYVYLREATKGYGAPRDAGAPRLQSDGSVAWTLTGLSSTTTYFVAVSAYTGTGLESAISNELPIGTPNQCVQDSCTSLAQCTLQTLPDGVSCGPAGATCGATCLAGVCTGLADRVLLLKRLRLKRSADTLTVRVKGSFVTSSSFDPLTDGLELSLIDPSGDSLVHAALAPTDLVSNPAGTVIRTVRRRSASGPVWVRRLRLRTHGDETRWKALVLVTPPPAALPPSAAVALESGTLCLSTEATGCRSSTSTLTCR